MSDLDSRAVSDLGSIALSDSSSRSSQMSDRPKNNSGTDEEAAKSIQKY